MGFAVVDRELVIQNNGSPPFKVSLLASLNQGKAFYLYNLDEIERRYQAFVKAFTRPVQVFYAMKANANPHALSRLRSLGAGVDVVSNGELQAADAFNAEKIVFSGVGKSVDEIKAALLKNIRQINVESLSELKRIIDISASTGQSARVALRVNPDVEPETHPYIRTGFRENKFGIDVQSLGDYLTLIDGAKGAVTLSGLTMHIGSQIRDLKVYEVAIRRLRTTFQDLRAKYNSLRTFDIGGGLGMDYMAESEDGEAIQNYAKTVEAALDGLDCELMTEPGRILVARAGVLICKVEYLKLTPYKNFAIVNTGMHHLLRPSLYQAFHRIVPLEAKDTGVERTYDVVGPICESADVLGHERRFRGLHEGDFLAILDTGAYGAAMSSHYNLQTPVKEFAFTKGTILEDQTRQSTPARII